MVPSGTRLGPYEIATLIGVGGMGEVYQATDTNLKRQVAIKVLPESVAADPERLARFQREAEVLAALSHPHVAAIHGLEKSSGTTALVMELVEGPTLADRIAQGPIPVDEALRIAKQIAEALEAAHEHGIVHRDLKPANVKVRDDGKVKVLDFGLAKALSNQPSSSNLSMSPTITSPSLMTVGGVILGTAAYMSPEQARGKAVDKRTDIWAFGCVLYEMLTGQRAFEDEDVSLTLSKVLQREPAFEKLPLAVPASVRRMLELCLKKDLRQRAADMQDVRLALEGAFEVSTVLATAAVHEKPATWRRTAAALVVLAVGLTIGTGTTWFATRPSAPQVSRFMVAATGAAALMPTGNQVDLSITSDGTRLVYRGSNGRIFVRALEQLDPTALPGLGQAQGPFVSPDGQWLGFNDGNQLKKVAITGGPALTVASLDGLLRGATWGPTGTIVFATAATGTGLQQVAAGGGDVTVLTKPDRERGEFDHFWPVFMPDGRSVLFTILSATGGPDSGNIALLDLETGQQTVLLRGGSHARYVPTGHLLYGAAGTLRAVQFDLRRRAVVGTAVPVLSPVAMTAVGGLQADVASNGTLVYLASTAGSLSRTLVWVDRQGREEPIATLPARPYMYPRLSPDGTRVALHSQDQELDLWVWSLAQQTLTRLTFDPAFDRVPLWLPDGQRLLFSSTSDGADNLYIHRADGTGDAMRVLESPNSEFPTGVSRDGAQIIFYEVTGSQQRDIRLLTLGPMPQVTSLVATRFDERGGTISPDGRWLAYEADNTGRYEIYVRPFPKLDGLWQVSTGGGVQPLWAADGREFFYVAPDGALMTVAVNAQESVWAAGTPVRLFSGPYYSGAGAAFTRHYDVTADGKRFLMLKDTGGENADGAQIVVVQNWTEELKRLVPTR